MKSKKQINQNEQKNKNLKLGFTLLELLVVVVIIGILAGIALPQYKESVEKSIMLEAAVNLRAIANANERFYVINGRYATRVEMNKLDITIPGAVNDYSQTGVRGDRVVTKHFIYSPAFGDGSGKAVALRIKKLDSNDQKLSYEFYISEEDDKFKCGGMSRVTDSVQKKLCTKIRDTGSL